MVTSPSPRYYSFDEYLDLEQEAEYKSEYHNGAIYAMSGRTRPHSRLSVRMIVLLSQSFPNCEVYDSNMNFYIEQIGKGVYPDCMALCGEVQYYNHRQDAILNPALVVEVLSPSTERYDKGNKVTYYHSVPSIRDIFLIAQGQVQVDHYSRTGDQTWTMICYSNREDSLEFMGTTICLNQIYANIL